MVAAAVIGSTVVGAGASMIGADKAASAQKDAANSSNATQLAMFDQIQQNLNPYMKAGTDALPQLQDMATKGFNFQPTEAQLQQTPGYQFNLYQGQKGVANSAAARGLANSGAALKGAAQYASGLADNTYQNQFGNALATYQNNLGALQNLVGSGQNAAANLGAFGTQTGQSIGNNIVGAGNARGAADVAMGNAFAAGANNYAGYNLASQALQGMYGNASQSSQYAWAPWQQPGYVNP